MDTAPAPRSDYMDAQGARDDGTDPEFMLVTLQTRTGERYLQLDAQTALLVETPALVSTYADNTRLLVQARILRRSGLDAYYSGVARIVWIEAVNVGDVLSYWDIISEQGPDSSPNPPAGPSDPPDLSGSPLEVLEDWMTVAEAGYLTVHYRILDSGQVQHQFRLQCAGKDYYLMHDAGGDTEGDLVEGLVCFPISLADQTEFNLHYLDFENNERVLTFEYEAGK